MAKRQSGGVECGIIKLSSLSQWNRSTRARLPKGPGGLCTGQSSGSTAPRPPSRLLLPGSWSIQAERGNALVVLRSLLWPGLTFFHAPRTKNCGYIYVGTGEKNTDLPFML